ncbi:VOC family protein [Haladaptatus caseinilyticus]|uniref:VOC family protein n=1 Tax=Haladaptatus caseinilyticus TaxID=2993314 RepID=UPI00224B117C|nr:VOC family protein [Haladaptatus caseinilyticus]
MLSGLRWLALEVKYLDRAREFYETYLDLSVREANEQEVVFDVGEHTLVLRKPHGIPRGGVHTHYAFSTPEARYDDWHDRLVPEFDLVEHDFGSARSLYFYDPDGNCVEIGGTDTDGDDITGIFEIVLEVETLERAERFYTDLGFETYNRGGDRKRVRMSGPFDLELWEPQLGIADARGGLHVDIGFIADDPIAVKESVEERSCVVESVDSGIRVRDPDGHYLTFLSIDSA